MQQSSDPNSLNHSSDRKPSNHSDGLNIPLNPENLSTALRDASPAEKGSFLRALNADSCHLQPSVKAALKLDAECPPQALIEFSRSLGLSASNITQSGGRFLALYTQPEKASAVSLVVYSLLLEAASSIKDEAIRRRFMGKRLPEKEMLEALGFAEAPARLKCLRAITQLAHIDSSVSHFCHQKLHNMLHFSSVNERAALLKEILSQPKSHRSRVQAETVLHSSYDLAQLTKVIAATGKNLLYEQGGARVRDFLARATILNKTRTLSLPGRLSAEASAEEIEA